MPPAKPEPCANCGGDCAPECGRHQLGCVYGGFSKATSYWIAVEDCQLDHSGPLEPLIMRTEWA